MKEIKYNVQEITKNLGERLVMFQLMKYRNWEVDYINYVGADLIALDREKNRRFAISVKTRNHESDGHSCSLFTYKDAENLKEFAAEMSDSKNPMIPIVAYVISKLDGTICTFLINLNDLEDMSQEGKIIKNGKGKAAYLFVYGNQSNPFVLKTDDGRQRNRKLDEKIFKEVLEEKRISHIITPLQSIRMDNDLYKDWDWEKYHLNKDMQKIQQGNFGESYIAWRARDYGMRSYIINSVGADIILQDKENKDRKYAVSVKTFSKKITDSYEFEMENVKYLKDYAFKWGMIPVVSLLFVINSENTEKGKIIYNFNMKLDYIEKEAAEKKIGWINICDKKQASNSVGYRFKWNEEILLKLQNEENIICTKIKID